MTGVQTCALPIYPDDILKCITKRTKAIMINSPSNPTGAVYSKGVLRKIGELAVSKNLLIITDEIYEKLIYDGIKHVSLASLGKKIKEHTITVNGVSKTYAMTGWRIGYTAASLKFIKKMSALQSHSTSNPTSISQKAAYCALTSDQDAVAEMVNEFDRRRKEIVKGLNSIKGFSTNEPQGSFYCFCNIKETGLTSMELTNKLLDEVRIAVIPGVAFGDDNFIRVSFACSFDEIEEGISRMKKLFG